MVNDIQECCRLTGLDELTSTGFYYTWSNHTMWSKLDRAMVNPTWLQTYGGSSATFLLFGKHSDHSPILVKMGVDGEPVSRLFRFFNMWTMHGEFKTIVQDVWTADRLGSRKWAMIKNLKALKSPLKSLNRKEFGHISERAKRASLDLEETQQQMHDDQHNAALQQKVLNRSEKAKFLTKAERSFYYQKAKLHYLKNSDRPTKFFLGMVKRNTQRNHVASIRRADGTMTTSREEVHAEFLMFYMEFLGTRQPCLAIDLEVLHSRPRTYEDDSATLMGPILNSEIKDALFDISDDKAQGPDGFTAHFFKHSWDTVGPFLTETVKEFFRSGSLLKQWVTHCLSSFRRKYKLKKWGIFDQ
ncbi:hypothetical protein ACP275_07G101800 [Erythranthe tilingii]